MNYKEDIEKEFDKLLKQYPALDFRRPYKIESFLKAKINQVIDEMIGEERELKGYESAVKFGYDKKVQELKEYKKKFNE